MITRLCAYPPCATPFPILPGHDPRKRFCSFDCYNAYRSDPALQLAAFADRFWAKVDKTPGLGPHGTCWLWTAAFHGTQGYGNFRATPYKPGNVSAHVVSWFLTTGTWPPADQFVCHHCDTPLCVFPEHLFLGTHTDNMQDAARKGRNARKLTHEQFAEALTLYATGQWSIRALATKYSVTNQALGDRFKRHRASIYD